MPFAAKDLKTTPVFTNKAKQGYIPDMKIYLRTLAALYFIGFLLHSLDILGLRLDFKTMSMGWKVWIVYLLVADFFAAIGLWLQKPWGVGLFLFIAISQLTAYIGYKGFFGDQTVLIAFHLTTLIMFIGFIFRMTYMQKKSNSPKA